MILIFASHLKRSNNEKCDKYLSWSDQCEMAHHTSDGMKQILVNYLILPFPWGCKYASKFKDYVKTICYRFLSIIKFG